MISCPGVGNNPQTLLSPPPLFTDGTLAIYDALEARGIARLVVFSARFLFETGNRGPIWFSLPAVTAFNDVFDQMAQVELLLQSRTSIAWTALRHG